MTKMQKETITRLRLSGYGYNRISKYTGINESTVKSFCRRHSLKKENLGSHLAMEETTIKLPIRYCKNCGQEVIQHPGRKEKKFCCNHCRNTWWNAHLEDVKRIAVYDFICPICGKSFSAYGNRNRKYCSHPCYIKARFGRCDDEGRIAESPGIG